MLNIREQLIGTWKMTSCVSRNPSGDSKPGIWGENFVGMLAYFPDDRMMVQIVKTDRRPFAVYDERAGTPEEIKESFEGLVCYFGTFSLEEATGTVYHHIEGASLPNMMGDKIKRQYCIEGTKLTLTVPAEPVAGEILITEITWEKLS